MYNVIIFADMISFQKEVSFQRTLFLESLKKIGIIQLYHPTEDVCIDDTDIVIFYFIRPSNHESCFEILSSFLHSSKYCFFYMEDIYHISAIKRLLKRYKVYNLILPMKHSYYESIFQRMGFQTYVLHTAFSVPKIYLQEKKTYDILLYGNTNPIIYPFRHRLFQLLLKHEQFFRVKHVPFLQQSSKHILEKQKILYRSISESRLCVATNSVYNFLIKKYLEIPLCGTAILGNIPSNYSDIFTEDSIVYVHRKMTDHEILSQIHLHLHDIQLLKHKTDVLQERIRSVFSLSNSVQEIKQIKKKLFSK